MSKIKVVASSCLIALGCGGLFGPSYSSVAYTHWEDHINDDRLRFTSDSTCILDWNNMAGSPVNCTFTESGETIHVVLEPSDNIGTKEMEFLRTGKCSAARTRFLTDNGWKSDSEIWMQIKPDCIDI